MSLFDIFNSSKTPALDRLGVDRKDFIKIIGKAISNLEMGYVDPDKPIGLKEGLFGSFDHPGLSGITEMISLQIAQNFLVLPDEVLINYINENETLHGISTILGNEMVMGHIPMDARREIAKGFLIKIFRDEAKKLNISDAQLVEECYT